MSAGPCLQAQALRPEGIVQGHPLDLTLWPGDMVGLQVLPPADDLAGWVRTLVGLQAPAAGRLALLGRPLAGLGERDLRGLRQRLGYVPAVDGAGLLPAWSGQDNLALSGPAPAAGWAAEAQRLGFPLHWLAEPVALRSRAQRHALAWWRVVRARPQCLVLSVWPWCLPGVEDLRWDVLWADAWATRPGVLVLCTDPPEGWPAPLRALLTRSGRFNRGQVEWM